MMKTTKITANEARALQGIYDSDFRDGADPVGHWVWSWSANTFDNPRVFGGVVAALLKKGLVAQSGPKGGSDQSCLALTAAGEAARREAGAPELACTMNHSARSVA